MRLIRSTTTIASKHAALGLLWAGISLVGACSSSKETHTVEIVEARVEKREATEPRQVLTKSPQTTVADKSCPNPLLLSNIPKEKRTTAAELMASDKGHYKLVGAEEFGALELDSGIVTHAHIGVSKLGPIAAGSFEYEQRIICHNQGSEANPTGVRRSGTSTATLDLSASDWISLSDGAIGPMRSVHFSLKNGNPSWRDEVKEAPTGFNFADLEESAKGADGMELTLRRSDSEHVHLHVSMEFPRLRIWIRVDYERVP